MGAYKGGRGPSADDIQRRRHLEQRKQASVFCKELDGYVERGEVMQLRRPERFVDETSSHRHDPLRKEVHVEKLKASATAKNSELDKRAAPRRNTRSNKFLRSLQIAKSCQRSFHVGNIVRDGQYSQEVTIIHNTGATYKATFDKMPFCDGCKYCTTRDICSHILWILLYVYNMPEESAHFLTLSWRAFSNLVHRLHQQPCPQRLQLPLLRLKLGKISTSQIMTTRWLQPRLLCLEP